MIIEKLKKLKPGENFLFIAIQVLKAPEEIKMFYQEYVEYLRQYGDSEEIRANPETVANKNIGYVIGYYNKVTAGRWFDVLPDISHPIFGRDIFSASPEDAFKAGQIASQKKIAKAREFL